MPVSDVLVLGRGPAGLAAAAALAERGLRVVSLAPAGPLHWPAEYGMWADEADALGIGDAVEHCWPETIVGFGAAERLVLGRGYVRIHKRELAARLRARCESGGVQWTDGEAAGVTHQAAESVVRCLDGRELRSGLVIDASGHRPALLQRRPWTSQGFQTAYGLTLEAETLFDPDRAVLMDWTDAHLSVADRTAGPPSFLYAMPLDDGRVFVEETVLVARPAVAPERLRPRLVQRLESLGVSTRRVVAEERVWIPMGGPLPSLHDRAVGFGAAAGLVHPATGYLLARTLADAPVLADAVRDGLDRGAPADAARGAWEALWTPDRRRRHALLCFGMEALLRLDAAATRDFFRSFFALPASKWQGYLSDALSSAAVAGVMRHVFLHAPMGVRKALVRLGAGPQGARLATRVLRASL